MGKDPQRTPESDLNLGYWVHGIAPKPTELRCPQKPDVLAVCENLSDQFLWAEVKRSMITVSKKKKQTEECSFEKAHTHTRISFVIKQQISADRG